MKKYTPKQMKGIQKKAIREVRQQEGKVEKTLSLVSTENGLILFISACMKEMLDTDTFVYQYEEKHKFPRYPFIKNNSKRNR